MKTDYVELEPIGTVKLVEYENSEEASDIKECTINASNGISHFYRGLLIEMPHFRNDIPTIHILGLDQAEVEAALKLLKGAILGDDKIAVRPKHIA